MFGMNRDKRASRRRGVPRSTQGVPNPIVVVVQAPSPTSGPKSTFDPGNLERNNPVSAGQVVNLHAASNGRKVLRRQEQSLRLGER